MGRFWLPVPLALSLVQDGVRAGLTVDLLVYRDEFTIATYGLLSANAPPPAAAFGGYRIRSPHFPTNGSELFYELDGSGLSFLGGSGSGAGTFGEFMTALTNGPWTLQFTNNTTTNLYTFTVSASGLSSNLLRAVSITYPSDGDPDVPPNPVFTWEGGPIGWQGTLHVAVYDNMSTFFQYDTLAPGQTNWTSPTAPARHPLHTLRPSTPFAS